MSGVDAIQAPLLEKTRVLCMRTAKSAKRMSRLAASGTPKVINANRLRDVMFYSSKLLKRPLISLRDVDLYTVLPKAQGEPVYVKSDWERELETG
jgi:hypothetical protein